MIDFASHLLAWRKRHGLTQKEAAVILAVSLPTIWLWEKGKYYPLRLDTETFLGRMEKFNRKAK